MFNVISEEIDGVHSWFLEYYVKCKSGEIVVGNELILELDYVYRDFYNAQFRVVLADAHKRIAFIETKCKHSEAPHAGKPFILLLWEKAFTEALHALKLFDNELGKWVRKHQDALLLVGRKNGKTPFIAALCLAEYFCGPIGTKILCASNDYEQAALLYDAIDHMREESPSLERVTHRNQRGIFFGGRKQKKKHGKFTQQNKGQIKKLSAKAGSKEGRNIGVGAVDEVFEMEDDSLVMPIRQALSTQDEPLYFELTTEGFTDGGYLDQRLVDARKVLRGEDEKPRWLIWLYTQDCESEVWQNEQSWNKSNPSLGAVKRWGYLRGLVEEAKNKPSTRAFVLAKEFNIKQNNAQAWLPDAVIINPVSFDLESFRGAWYIGAVDISETTDLTNARALFIRKESDGRLKKYMLSMYFVPEAKADAELEEGNATNPERKNYREWAKQGLVTIIPGNEVDTYYIEEWYWSLYEKFEMKPYRIGYDNFDAHSMVRGLKGKFGEEVPVRVPMKYETLSNPMRTLEADLGSRDVIYHNDVSGYNEVDEWCLKNTAFKLNNLGLIMPVKVQGQSRKRIDGTLTMIICFCTYGWVKREFLELCACA